MNNLDMDNMVSIFNNQIKIPKNKTTKFNKKIIYNTKESYSNGIQVRCGRHLTQQAEPMSTFLYAKPIDQKC